MSNFPKKKCNRCGVTKSLSDFHVSTKTKDGYRGQCKQCRSDYEKERYKRCSVTIRERRRAYYHKNKDRINRNRKRNPLKTWAQNALNKAIAKGIIKRPKTCEKCSKKRKIQGHHEDYTKPLEVDWWCRSCHMSYHGLG